MPLRAVPSGTPAGRPSGAARSREPEDRPAETVFRCFNLKHPAEFGRPVRSGRCRCLSVEVELLARPGRKDYLDGPLPVPVSPLVSDRGCRPLGGALPADPPPAELRPDHGPGPV